MSDEHLDGICRTCDTHIIEIEGLRAKVAEMQSVLDDAESLIRKQKAAREQAESQVAADAERIAGLEKDRERVDRLALIASYDNEEGPTQTWLQFPHIKLRGYPMAAPLRAFRDAIDAMDGTDTARTAEPSESTDAGREG